MSETAKKQLLWLGICATLFFACTLLIVLFVDPFKASVAVLVLFYLSLGALCASLFTIVLFSLRRNREELLDYQRMRIAGREALLLAIFVVGSLLLSSKQLLLWWVEAIFIVTLVLIEIFFLI